MSSRGNVTGVINGFSTIDLSQGNTSEQIAPTHMTIAEIRQRIEAIRQNFDPDFLDALIVQVLSHIQNYDNPHQVTLAQTGVNIVQLVYQTWLSNGNTGTLQDFYAVLFQVMPVASTNDIAGGTSGNLVPVSGVTFLINTHNTDPNAHPELLDLIMPGTPPTALPSMACDARFGVPNNATVTRSTSLTCLDRNGNLVSYGPNTVAIDFSTGVALFPLYGARTNSIFPSNPNIAPDGWLSGTTMGSSPSGTLKVAPDGTVCAILIEDTGDTIHGYAVPITMAQYLEYTASVFIYPLQTTGGMTLYVDSQPQLQMMVDLTTLEVTTPAGVYGYAQPLRNGWIRLGLQYLAPISGAANLMIIKTPTSVIGDTMVYQGTSAPICGLFGLQHVQGSGMSPYIPTIDEAVSHDASVMTISATVINATNGLISVAFDQSYQILQQGRTLLTFGSNLTFMANAGEITISTTNTDATQSYLNEPATYDALVTTAFSFAPNAYALGTTGQIKTTLTGETLDISSGAITLTLGNATLPLEGGVHALAFYPLSETNEEIEFLTGTGAYVTAA